MPPTLLLVHQDPLRCPVRTAIVAVRSGDAHTSKHKARKYGQLDVLKKLVGNYQEESVTNSHSKEPNQAISASTVSGEMTTGTTW